MRVGISLTSGYPGSDGTAAVRTVLDRARAAAAAELDHLSLGDHHATGPHRTYVQNVPMLGRILAEWPSDRQAGLLILLPLWHPVLAAEQIGTLASLSERPLIVQTGIGSGEQQFAAMGASLTTRGRLTDVAIDVMRRLFDGETVDEPDLEIAGACIAPVPPHGVEWWVGAGSAPAAIDRAARQGDAWYVGPGLDGDALRVATSAYHDACEHHGRRPRIALRRDVLVGDDHDATVRRAAEVIDRGYRGLGRQVVAGGVEAVTERLAAFDVDDVVVRTIDVEQREALRSIELVGEVRRRLA